MEISWIYNRKVDLRLTGVIILFTVLYVRVLSPSFIAPSWGILEFPLLPLLFDQTHVLITFLRGYVDTQLFNENRKLFIIIPIFCFVLAVILRNSSMLVFLSFYGHLSLFHFIRQQYGWLMMSIRKEGEKGKWELLLNKIFFYNLIVTPFLTFRSMPKNDFKWIGTIFSFPESFYPIFYSIFIFVLGCNIIYEIYLYRKIRNINYSKYNQYFLALASWYVAPFLFKDVFLAYVLIMTSHGLTYLYAGYHIYVAGSKKKNKRHYSAWILYPGLVFATVLYWNFGGYNTAIIKMALPSRWGYFIIIPATISWTHYILDGFIWRTRRNRSVKEAFS